jgi:hypothetical protein
MTLFGDKSKFAIEIEFKENDPFNRGYDDSGTYCHFDIFIHNTSMFKIRCFHFNDDPNAAPGYRILKTYDEYDDGRTDCNGPIFRWIEQVYYTVTKKSKTRFKMCDLTRPWDGTEGNIYPKIMVKQCGKSITVRHKGEAANYSHVLYPANGEITLPNDDFIKIISEFLTWLYDQECINTQEWFKNDWHPKIR